MLIKDGIGFHNVEELVWEEKAGGWAMSRVPAAVRAALNEPARAHRSINPCGCELRFNLHSEEAVIVLRRDDAANAAPQAVAEVFFGAFQGPYGQTPAIVGTEPTEITVRKRHIQQLAGLSAGDAGSFDPQLVKDHFAIRLESVLYRGERGGLAAQAGTNAFPTLSCLRFIHHAWGRCGQTDGHICDGHRPGAGL